MNYRLAVLLGHHPGSPWHGRLFNAGEGHPAVLDSGNMSLSQIQSELSYTLNNTVGDSTPGGDDEEGLNTFYHALDPSNLAANRSLGFFRPNTALVAVYLANEADMCGLPDTDPGTDDDWAAEYPVKLRDCAGVTPLSIYQRVQALQGSNPFILAAGIYTNLNQQSVGGNEAEYGWGYAELVQIASGKTIDLVNADFAGGLSDLGALVTKKLDLVLDFTLGRSGAEPASVQVKVDGSPVSSNYVSQTNQVHITNGGHAASSVDILYCLAH